MSSSARWSAGIVPVAVSENGFIVLDGQNVDTLELLWEKLAQGEDLSALLQTMVVAHDNDVFSLPDFLIAVFNRDVLSVAARGKYSLHVATREAEDTQIHAFSAPQVIAWEESHFRAVVFAELALETDANTDPHDDLPISAGIVRASQLRWGDQSASEKTGSPLSEENENKEDVELAQSQSAGENPLIDFNVTLDPADLERSECGLENARSQDDAQDRLEHTQTGLVISDVPSPASAGSASAVTIETEEEPTDSASSQDQWQHDGRTVTSAQLQAMQEAAQAAESKLPLPGENVKSANSVLCMYCEAGHPNPTHISNCRICGKPIIAKYGRIAPPSLGVLHSSTGETLALDRDVVVGRLPEARSDLAQVPPRLLVVPSPNKEISKSHCVIHVSDWDLSVEDLESMNGTFLIRSGEEPRRLAPKQQVFLRIGDLLDLGDDVVLTVASE